MHSSSMRSRERTCDEEHSEQNAEQYDVVAQMVEQLSPRNRFGQQVRRDAVESVDCHQQPEEGRRDEKHPSDSLEPMGQQQCFVHGCPFLSVSADRRRCALLPSAVTNVKFILHFGKYTRQKNCSSDGKCLFRGAILRNGRRGGGCSR